MEQAYEESFTSQQENSFDDDECLKSVVTFKNKEEENFTCNSLLEAKKELILIDRDVRLILTRHWNQTKEKSCHLEECAKILTEKIHSCCFPDQNIGELINFFAEFYKNQLDDNFYETIEELNTFKIYKLYFDHILRQNSEIEFKYLKRKSQIIAVKNCLSDGHHHFGLTSDIYDDDLEKLTRIGIITCDNSKNVSFNDKIFLEFLLANFFMNEFQTCKVKESFSFDFANFFISILKQENHRAAQTFLNVKIHELKIDFTRKLILELCEVVKKEFNLILELMDKSFINLSIFLLRIIITHDRDFCKNMLDEKHIKILLQDQRFFSISIETFFESFYRGKSLFSQEINANFFLNLRHENFSVFENDILSKDALKQIVCSSLSKTFVDFDSTRNDNDNYRLMKIFQMFSIVFLNKKGFEKTNNLTAIFSAIFDDQTLCKEVLYVRYTFLNEICQDIFKDCQSKIKNFQELLLKIDENFLRTKNFNYFCYFSSLCLAIEKSSILPEFKYSLKTEGFQSFLNYKSEEKLNHLNFSLIFYLTFSAELLSQDDFSEILQQQDENGDSFLHHLTRNNLVILSQQQHKSKNWQVLNYIFIFIQRKINSNTFFEEILKLKNIKGKNIFHNIAKNSETFWDKAFLDYLVKISLKFRFFLKHCLNDRDSKNYIPLHYAIKNNELKNFDIFFKLYLLSFDEKELEKMVLKKVFWNLNEKEKNIIEFLVESKSFHHHKILKSFFLKFNPLKFSCNELLKTMEKGCEDVEILKIKINNLREFTKILDLTPHYFKIEHFENTKFLQSIKKIENLNEQVDFLEKVIFSGNSTIYFKNCIKFSSFNYIESIFEKIKLILTPDELKVYLNMKLENEQILLHLAAMHNDIKVFQLILYNIKIYFSKAEIKEILITFDDNNFSPIYCIFKNLNLVSIESINDDFPMILSVYNEFLTEMEMKNLIETKVKWDENERKSLIEYLLYFEDWHLSPLSWQILNSFYDNLTVDMKTLLSILLNRGKLEDLKKLFVTFEEKYEKEKLLMILQIKNEIPPHENILQLAIKYSESHEIFEFLWENFSKYFAREKLAKIILAKNEHENNLIYYAISDKSESLKSFKVIINFLSEQYEKTLFKEIVFDKNSKEEIFILNLVKNGSLMHIMFFTKKLKIFFSKQEILEIFEFDTVENLVKLSRKRSSEIFEFIKKFLKFFLENKVFEQIFLESQKSSDSDAEGDSSEFMNFFTTLESVIKAKSEIKSVEEPIESLASTSASISTQSPLIFNLVKIDITRTFSYSEIKDVQELLSSIEKSFLVVVTSKDEKHCQFFWRLEGIQMLLYLPLKSDTICDDIKKFIKSFLINSLKSSHSGLDRKINPDRDLIYQTITLMALYDRRGFSILMLAAKDANFNIVKFLIENDLNVNYRIHNLIAADLVSQEAENYDDIILALLKENSPFPRTFAMTSLKRELSLFLSDMQAMHMAVKKENERKIKELIKKYPSLKFFFVPDQTRHYKNISAKKLAEENKSRKVLNIFEKENIVKQRFEHENTERSVSTSYSSPFSFLKNLFFRS